MIITVSYKAVADPGFPVGRGDQAVGGGHQLPTQALFSENVCENKRIGSSWGACTGGAPLDQTMQGLFYLHYFAQNHRAEVLLHKV